jgi:hypothetical protein
MDVSLDILDANDLFRYKECFVMTTERVKYLYTQLLKSEFYIAFKTVS